MMYFKSLFMFLFGSLFFFVSFNCVADGVSGNPILNGAEKAFTYCDGLHGVNVINNGRVVCIRGKIDPKMFVDLLKRRNDIKQRPYVVISGIGGYGDSSIYMVKMLDAYDPIPVVGDMCASACAQFLFLMGKRRVLLHCADLVMHGGPPSIEEALSWDNDYVLTQRIIANISQVKEFYKNKGVSMDMITKPPSDAREMLRSGQIVFWPWSISKFRSFGVKGIISDNDPDEVVPKDYKEKCLGN